MWYCQHAICHGFPWFFKVLGAQASPAGAEPPEAGPADPEQSRSEDFIRIVENLEEFQGWERFFEEFHGRERFSTGRPVWSLLKSIGFSRFS